VECFVKQGIRLNTLMCYVISVCVYIYVCVCVYFTTISQKDLEELLQCGG